MQAPSICMDLMGLVGIKDPAHPLALPPTPAPPSWYLPLPIGICPVHHCPPGPGPCDDLRITQRGSSYRGGENEKEEGEEVKRYQEFQKRQVQSLLELREAQVDTEAERRLEHLRQVRRTCGSKGEPASGTDRASACVTCWPPVSTGSAAAQGSCPGCSHNSVQEAEGDK